MVGLDEPGDYALVDGGTFANNPAMCAYAEAMRDHPDADILGASHSAQAACTESISVQAGGALGSAGVGATTARPDHGRHERGNRLPARPTARLRNVRHFRFQTVLEGVSDSLDDANPANIEGLAGLAKTLIKDSAAQIAAVCELL